MKAIKKMEITKVLSCFLVFVILMSLAPVFVTQSDAVILVENYMGKVVGRDIENNELTVQIEYKADYSTEQVSSWVPYHSTSQWTVSNSDAINEIGFGDYIEIAGYLGVGSEGDSICIGKIKSSTEKSITDVYGDPGYLVPVHTFIEHPGVLNPPLLGDYIITYENIPDCSKYSSDSFGCNVEAKYSDVTISKGNEQLQSQRLYPGRSFKYEDKGRGYNIDITFNSGEAPACPDCTDQPCLGPQAFSDFTIHIKKIEEKMPDLIIQDISWSPSNPKEGDTVTFTVTVKNQGSGSAGYSYVYYYIGGSYVDYDYVPSLSAGSTSTQSFTWTEEYVPQMSARKTVSAAEWKVPKAFPIVKTCADATDLVDESNEDNNCREETVEIYEEKKPDLVIEDITWSPSKLKQGDKITFTVKIKNRGDGNAGTSTVRYYIDGSYVTSDSVSGLSAGSTSTQTFTWTADKCGNVQVKAVADATNAIDESNEENNQSTETVNIVCPTVSILQVPYEFQEETLWCGPASTAMVLKYYGKKVHMWDIADTLNLTGKDGTNAGDLFNYIKRYSDLSIHEGNDDPNIDDGEHIYWYPWPTGASKLRDYLVSELTTDKNPVILCINKIDHDVVVVGVSSKDALDPTFYVNDPSGHLLEKIGVDISQFTHIKYPVKWSQIEQFWTIMGGAFHTLSVQGNPNPPEGSLSNVNFDVYLPAYLPLASRSYNDGLKWNFSGSEYPVDDYSASFDSKDSLGIGAVIANHMDFPQKYVYKFTTESGYVLEGGGGETPVIAPKEISWKYSSAPIGDWRFDNGEIGLYMELYNSNNKLLDKIGPIRFNVVTSVSPGSIVEEV